MSKIERFKIQKPITVPGTPAHNVPWLFYAHAHAHLRNRRPTSEEVAVMSNNLKMYADYELSDDGEWVMCADPKPSVRGDF